MRCRSPTAVRPPVFFSLARLPIFARLFLRFCWRTALPCRSRHPFNIKVIAPLSPRRSVLSSCLSIVGRVALLLAALFDYFLYPLLIAASIVYYFFSCGTPWLLLTPPLFRVSIQASIFQFMQRRNKFQSHSKPSLVIYFSVLAFRSRALRFSLARWRGWRRRFKKAWRLLFRLRTFSLRFVLPLLSITFKHSI